MQFRDKSIEPRDNSVKNLPSKNLFGHIIGQIDSDNGISGLEKSLDKDLKNNQEKLY